MPSINKNSSWDDRKTKGGKGDYFAQDMTGYRAGALWGRSSCCKAPLRRIPGTNKEVCEECNKTCMRDK